MTDEQLDKIIKKFDELINLIDKRASGSNEAFSKLLSYIRKIAKKVDVTLD